MLAIEVFDDLNASPKDPMRDMIPRVVPEPMGQRSIQGLRVLRLTDSPANDECFPTIEYQIRTIASER